MADDTAIRDGNRVPSIGGEGRTSGDYKNVKVDEDDGAILAANVPARRADAFQVTVHFDDASGGEEVVAAESGKSIYITDIAISCDTKADFQFQDDQSTPEVLIEKLYLNADATISLRFATPLKVAEGQALNVVASGTSGVTVLVTGYKA